MRAKKETRSEIRLPPQSRDLPATQGMLQLVRTEAKENTRELRSEMKAGFKQVDARFDEVWIW